MKTTELTIQEAIQSGLPFKRPHEVTYSIFKHYPDSKMFSKEDLLATDWQIEAPEVTITRDKLAEAWDKMSTIYPYVAKVSDDSKSFAILAKELGL